MSNKNISFKSLKPIFLLLFLVPIIISFLSYKEPAHSLEKEDLEIKNKENNPTSQQIKSNQSKPGQVNKDKIYPKWTEALTLKDFYLSPNFIELKQNNKLNEYKNTLRKNYGKNPDVFSAAVEYGLILIDLRELDRAKEIWERAVNDFQGNPTPKVYKAWIDACKGDYLVAKNVWYPIAKEKLDGGINVSIWFPYHVDSVVGLNSIKNYLPPKEKEEVEKLVNEIAKHFANNPKFASILITNDLQSGRLKEATEKFTNILNRYPDEPLTITLLGVSQLIIGDNKEALKLFDKANDLNPYSPTNHLMRARALHALNKDKESKLALEQAIKLNSDFDPKSIKKSKILSSKSYLTSLKKSPKSLFVPENPDL